MSELTERLRAEINKMDWEESVVSSVINVLHQGADALEAAEAKLAAIDAAHRPRIAAHPHLCDQCSLKWPCPTHRILHPEEEQ